MTPDRPLLVIPAGRASAPRRPPSPRGKQTSPKKGRLVERLGPRFAILEGVLSSRNAELASTAEGFAPEHVVVFETTATNARALVRALQETPELSWLASSDLEGIVPDDDFHDVEKPSKLLTARLFMVMANVQALTQLLSLWKRWSSASRAKLPAEHKAWSAAFSCLRDVRLWGPKDRIQESELRLWWAETKSLGASASVEIELWFRSSSDDRAAAAASVEAAVVAAGGRVEAASVIEPIRYHAILARLPSRKIEGLFDESTVELVRADGIYLFRPTPQHAYPVPSEGTDTSDVESSRPFPPAPVNLDPPTVALLDGLPLERHRALDGWLRVDDPDEWGSDYSAVHRRHGTAMASLLIHGDRNVEGPVLSRSIYVRPILRPRDDLSGSEEAPLGELWIDVLHRAVVQIVGTSNRTGAAPTVRVINLSVGDRYRPFVNEISPLARLIDWLSWKHQILFVVSAGNHLAPLVLETGSESTESRAFRALQREHRHRRLLSPAESINALTVGALHEDGGGPWSRRHVDEVELVSSPGMPSPVSALGRGHRKSVKPELFAPGGRVVHVRHVDSPDTHSVSFDRRRLGPGHRAAAPQRGGVLTHEEYSCGTSNAAALVTRTAMMVIDATESLRRAYSNLDAVPPALLAKCLLVHTSAWGEKARSVLSSSLRTPENESKLRDHLAGFVGYGSLRSERALACTVSRATLVGGGVATLGSCVEHRVPLPGILNAYTGVRRIVITLAWFSPTRSGNRKYRVAALDVVSTQSRGTFAVTGVDVDGIATKRGTLQHTVLEGSSGAVNAYDDAELVLKINAVREVDGDLDESIPYALAVSVEVPESTEIPIYDAIRARLAVRIKAPA